MKRHFPVIVLFGRKIIDLDDDNVFRAPGLHIRKGAHLVLKNAAAHLTMRIRGSITNRGTISILRRGETEADLVARDASDFVIKEGA